MSLFEDTYRTIDEPSEGIFRDKGSKFIAYAHPFKDENKGNHSRVESIAPQS